MQHYVVDVEYLAEPDAFDSNRLVDNWQACQNRFLTRTALGATVGFRAALSIEDFSNWIAAHVLSLPCQNGVALDLVFSGDHQVEFEVVDHITTIQVPIEADNPGFLVFALNWFQVRRPKIRVYATEGVFWVEGRP